MQGSLFDVADGNVTRAPRRVSSVPHQQAVDGWARLWREARGCEWVWSPRDFAAIRRALGLAGGNASALLVRAWRLLSSPPSAWYAQNASPTLLASKWNELAVEVRARANSRDDANLESLRRAAMEL